MDWDTRCKMKHMKHVIFLIAKQVELEEITAQLVNYSNYIKTVALAY